MVLLKKKYSSKKNAIFVVRLEKRNFCFKRIKEILKHMYLQFGIFWKKKLRFFLHVDNYSSRDRISKKLIRL